MSTVVAPVKAIRHGLILGGRGIRKIFKNPEQLLDVTIAPLSVLVVFVYLFGGAIAGDTDTYLHTLVPGIMVMTTFQACMGTGMTLNNDVTKGVFDRFRSLPIARSAPLVGAVLADFVRYLVCLGVLVAVATLMGYRVQTDPALLVVAVALMVAFGMCFCWISVFVGMLVRQPVALQGLMATLILPVAFGSDIFVPAETMPGWLRAWAEINPLSLMANTLRGLLNGGPVGGPLLGALGWMVGVVAVFFPLAMLAYRRR